MASLAPVKPLQWSKSQLFAVLCIHIITMSADVSGAKSPKIKMKLPYTKSTAKNTIVYSEETPPNSLIGLVEISGAAATDSWDCEAQNMFVGLVSLGTSPVYSLTLHRHFDHELEDEVVVNIVCTNSADPTHSLYDSLTIIVEDVNDNPPAFILNEYQADLKEHEPNGTFVLKVEAPDLDGGENGKVRYSLHQEEYGYFRIDPDTGEILTNKDIDREELEEIRFMIIATDFGHPQMSAEVNVTVHIKDINDNIPVLLTDEIHVLENLKPMSVVGHLEGEDLDIGKNAEIFFTKADELPFYIWPNGTVTAAVPLDRERRSYYKLKVIVADEGKPRQSSTATVKIIVDDVNDNAPRVVSPCLEDSRSSSRQRRDIGGVVAADANSDHYRELDNSENVTAEVFELPGFLSIDWFSPEGRKVVHQLRATDADVGVNKDVVFSIHSLNGLEVNEEDRDYGGLFTIDQSSGEIFLRRYLLKTDDLQQLVNVSVQDKGTPLLGSFCALNITFDVDVGDLPEDIVQSPPYSFGEDDQGVANVASQTVSKNLVTSLASIVLTKILQLYLLPHHQE